jgi:photosystem II stability/assembly factor-like uncharacterized protein
MPVTELQLDRGRPDLLYVKADDHLWRSNDAGATWHSLQPGLGHSVKVFALDPNDRRTIWVWTPDYQLWRSRDAGETWSRRLITTSDFPSVVQLLVDSVDPETVYRVDEYYDAQRVWVSHDGGASFQAGAFLPITTLFAGKKFFIHPQRSELLFFGDQGVLTSRDGGQTWSRHGLYHGKGFYYGRPAPSDPDTLYAISLASGCPVRSDDAGAHWLRLACPHLRGYSYGFSDLAVDPQSASHVWLVADVSVREFQHWLLESNDGGASWSPPRLMPEGAVVSAGGSLVYAGSAFSSVLDYPERGLSASRDGGRTWTSLAAGISAGSVYRAFVVQRSPDAADALDALDADDGWRLVALALAPNLQFGLFLSNRGGKWVQSPGRFSDLAATGGSTAVAVKEDRVVRSQDGGVTWSAVPSVPTTGGFLVDAMQPRYLALLHFVPNRDYGDLVLWTSDDGGATWRRSSNGRSRCIPAGGSSLCGFFLAFAVDPFDATHRCASVYTVNGVPSWAIDLSTDAGLTWHPTPPVIADGLPVSALAADPASPGRFLAGTYYGLFLSEDGGLHWQPWGDLPSHAMVYQLVRDERTATWYAATGAEGIYRSLDGGAHWTLLAGAPDLDRPTIAIDPRTPDTLIAAFKGLGVWQWTP